MNRMMTVLLILAGAAIPPAWAARSLPVDYIKYPVMVQLDTGRSASGFYITGEAGDAYFVTARHLFFEKDERGTYRLKGRQALLLSYPREEFLEEPILLRLDLPELERGGFLLAGADRDVAVVKVGEVRRDEEKKSLFFSAGVNLVSRGRGETGEGTIVGAQREVIKTYDEVATGNDVFIFGYPNSLGIENYPQIDYERPLLRKGIIAGKNNELETIILDCPVFYGNSGGPVVEVERRTIAETRYSIVGMVSEFVPFDDKWYGLRRPIPTRQIENSGYSVVIPMDVILNLIEEMRESLRREAEALSETAVL